MGKRGVINPTFGCTESAFFGKIRAALRQQWKYSQAHKDAIKRATRPYTGAGQRRISIICECCNTEYARQEKIEVESAKKGIMRSASAYVVHHIIPCGSLKCWADIRGFAERLFCKVDKLLVLCYTCHKKAHEKEGK